MENPLGLLQTSGKSVPSNLSNPFCKECITYITMDFSNYSWQTGPKMVEGYIKFTKGDTEGKQKFTAPTFELMIQQMYNFCLSL